MLFYDVSEGRSCVFVDHKTGQTVKPKSQVRLLTQHRRADMQAGLRGVLTVHTHTHRVREYGQCRMIRSMGPGLEEVSSAKRVIQKLPK